jgi:predicted HTH domain antitoxin
METTPQVVPVGPVCSVDPIHKIADTLVQTNMITQKEADVQVAAINNFFKGNISYAEMRRLAG